MFVISNYHSSHKATDVFNLASITYYEHKTDQFANLLLYNQTKIPYQVN